MAYSAKRLTTRSSHVCNVITMYAQAEVAMTLSRDSTTLTLTGVDSYDVPTRAAV